MTKFTPADAYEPEPIPLSANRQALLDLNEARTAATAEVETLRARMASLARLKDAVGPIEAELAALDAAEADALAQWSASPDAPAPQPDTAVRADIMTRLQSARQQVVGAQLATASVESVLERANAKAGELEAKVPAFVAAVLVDEARSILPAIVEATLALAKHQVRYTALRDFLLSRAEAARSVAMGNGFFAALEGLDREAREAAGNAPPPDFNATLEWREMAAALGDTAPRPTPAPVAMFNLPEETKW